jgi:hypothetical protein
MAKKRRAKLNPMMVCFIRLMYDKGEFSIAELAREFRVTWTAIYFIVNDMTWR